jgi:hypothetical protein
MKGGCVVSNNLLIVESANDKHFIERLKAEIQLASFEIDSPICCINEYECLDGLSLERLKKKLIEIKRDIGKRSLSKVGVLLDADDKGIENRIKIINEAISFITEDVKILETNTWYKSETLDIDISCHILNVNGSGELETLLKEIKSENSIFADCLYSWQECLTKNNKEISKKEFDKFWISIYGRYDHCDKSEQKQAGRKCNLEASLQKNIWNFSHSALNDLKNYLAMFN